jgi:hypothetical protein
MAIRFKNNFACKPTPTAHMQIAHNLAAAREHEKKIQVKPLGVSA